jgi:hypothetical protein
LPPSELDSTQIHIPRLESGFDADAAWLRACGLRLGFPFGFGFGLTLTLIGLPPDGPPPAPPDAARAGPASAHVIAAAINANAATRRGNRKTQGTRQPRMPRSTLIRQVTVP